MSSNEITSNLSEGSKMKTTPVNKRPLVRTVSEAVSENSGPPIQVNPNQVIPNQDSPDSKKQRPGTKNNKSLPNPGKRPPNQVIPNQGHPVSKKQPDSKKQRRETKKNHSSSKSQPVPILGIRETKKKHSSPKKQRHKSLPNPGKRSPNQSSSKSRTVKQRHKSFPIEILGTKKNQSSTVSNKVSNPKSLRTKSAVNPCDKAKYTLEEIQNLKDGIKSCIDKIQIKSCDNITEYTEENKKSESEELEEYLRKLEELNNSAALDFISKTAKPKPKEYYIPYIVANLIQRNINLLVIANLLNIDKIDNAPYFYHNLLKDLGYKYSLENFLNIYSFGKNRTITKILAEAKKIYSAIDKLKEYGIIHAYDNIFLLPKHVELIEDIKKLLSSISFVNLPIIMKRLTIYQLMNIKKVLICLIIIEDLIHSYEISDKKDKDFSDDNFIKPCLLLQNIYLYLFIFLLKYSDSKSDSNSDSNSFSKSVINDDLLKFILIICLIIEKGGIFQNNQPIQINSYPILRILRIESLGIDKNFYTLSPDKITHNILKKIHGILVDKGFNFKNHLSTTSFSSLLFQFGYDEHKIVKNENVSKDISSKDISSKDIPDIPIENILIENLLGTQEEVGTHKTDVTEEEILKLWEKLDIGKDSKVFDRLPDF